jgi:hypothetical protein
VRVREREDERKKLSQRLTRQRILNSTACVLGRTKMVEERRWHLI